MPNNPLRPCRKLGCPNLTRDTSGYCDKHRYIYEEQQKQWKDNKEYEQKRKSSNQRGYNGRWRKARETYLKHHPLCVECLKEGRYVPSTVVDHIKPHRGNQKLFWDTNNWQPLCKHHHDMKTASGK